MDSSITLPLPEAESPSEAPRERSRARLIARVRAAAIALAAVAALAFGADQLTSSPAVCGACHEMAPRTSAWRVSPHVNVKCVSCHAGPHAWYELPQALYARAALLGHDTVRHFQRGDAGPVDSRPAGFAPMSDRVCEQCHDPDRKPTAGLGILIDHPKHARRNGSCVTCHVTVAHPKASRGTALSFMGQCFTCHGTAAQPKASAACRVCHPADFKLKPVSHEDAKWKRAHGRVSLADPKQCAMCHKAAFCDSCHGLRMPHPADWATKAGHPTAAQQDRRACTKCHTGKPDFCAMCHHKAYVPAKGTWVKQHFLAVEEKGAFACLESCHSPVFCSRCHVRGGVASNEGEGSGS